MAKQFSDDDIASFLKAVIELGEAQTVDDSPDKYIRSAISGEQVTITQEGKRVPLAIYGTSATDALIVNPFAEGETEAARTSWFFESRNVILGTLIAGVMEKLLTIGAENKDKKKADKGEENRIATKYLSKHVLDIDAKMIDEFVSLRQDIYEFFHITYNKTKRIGEVKCMLFNPALRKGYKKIRQKSWDVFEGLMFSILGTEDLNDFTYTPDSIGIPAFEAFVNILVNVYDHIQEAVQIVGIKINSLNSLKSHLKYLKEYQAAAAWCASANVGQTVPTQVSPAPWSMPQSTMPSTVMPIPAMNQGYGMMPPMMPSSFGAIPTGSTLPPTLTTANNVPGMQQPVLMPQQVTPMSRETDNPFITR